LFADGVRRRRPRRLFLAATRPVDPLGDLLRRLGHRSFLSWPVFCVRPEA
jgi:hypothetical protein